MSRFNLIDKRVEERFKLVLKFHVPEAYTLNSILKKALSLHENPQQIASFTEHEVETIKDFLENLKKVL